MKPTSKTWEVAAASSTGGGLHGAIDILPFYIDPLVCKMGWLWIKPLALTLAPLHSRYQPKLQETTCRWATYPPHAKL